MLEILVSSLFVGSLGLQAVVISSRIRWQKNVKAMQEKEEEEILTPYESKENSTVEQYKSNGTAKPEQKDPRLVGWEFKIVRANRYLFRDPAVLQRLCDEEAESGWIMLEKLDDRRVRFKRPLAMREIINKIEFLNYDPYRCQYGSAWQPLNWFGAIAILIAMVLPAYLGYVFVSQALTNSRLTPIAPASFPPVEQSPNP